MEMKQFLGRGRSQTDSNSHHTGEGDTNNHSNNFHNQYHHPPHNEGNNHHYSNSNSHNNATMSHGATATSTAAPQPYATGPPPPNSNAPTNMGYYNGNNSNGNNMANNGAFSSSQIKYQNHNPQTEPRSRSRPRSSTGEIRDSRYRSRSNRSSASRSSSNRSRVGGSSNNANNNHTSNYHTNNATDGHSRYTSNINNSTPNSSHHHPQAPPSSHYSSTNITNNNNNPIVTPNPPSDLHYTTPQVSSSQSQSSMHHRRPAYLLHRDLVIGRGSYGQVCIASRGESEGGPRGRRKKFACKCVVLRHDAKYINKLQEEVNVLRELRGHENVIRLFDVFCVDNELFIITELGRGGDLFHLLTTHPKHGVTEAYAGKFKLFSSQSLIPVVSQPHLFIPTELPPSNLY